RLEDSRLLYSFSSSSTTQGSYSGTSAHNAAPLRPVANERRWQAGCVSDGTQSPVCRDSGGSDWARSPIPHRQRINATNEAGERRSGLLGAQDRGRYRKREDSQNKRGVLRQPPA